MPEFKDMLKYFRMREGLSQSELADKLGVSTSRISMYEVGKREPDFETEEKIADFFNTDLNTLRGRDIETEERPVDYVIRTNDGTELLVETYYLNEETRDMAQAIFENKELRALFDTARNASPDDLATAHNMLLALKRKEQGNID